MDSGCLDCCLHSLSLQILIIKISIKGVTSCLSISLAVFAPPLNVLPVSLLDHQTVEENNLARSVSVATGLNNIVKKPRVRTIFPHTAGNNNTLLSFDEGDVIILLIPEEKDGWMYGEMEKNGK